MAHGARHTVKEELVPLDRINRMAFPLSGREREKPIGFAEVEQTVVAPLAGSMRARD
jgi:hypothetical protein